MPTDKETNLALASQAKATLLGSISKTQQLAESSASKEALLSPAQYPDTLDQYKAEHGAPSLDVIRHYVKKAFMDQLNTNDRLTKEQQQREAGAWTTDAELDTPLGQASNFGAYTVQGGARTVGFLASLPANLVGATQLSGISDEERTAFDAVTSYERQVNSISNDPSLTVPQKDEQISKLSKPEEAYNILDKEPEYDPYQGAGQVLSSPRKRINLALDSLGLGSDLADFIQKPVEDIANTLDRDNFIRDLSQTYGENSDFIKDVGDAIEQGAYGKALVDATAGASSLLLQGFGDAFNNPAGVAGYVAENVPQLVLGGFSKTGQLLQTSGYAADMFNANVKSFQEKEGRLPNRIESTQMLAIAASAGLAEQIGDAKIFKSFQKAVPDVPATVAKPKSVVGKAVDTKVGVVTKAAATETATEAYQTTAEEGGDLQGDISGEAVFQGAVIGGASGGAVSTVGQSKLAAQEAVETGKQILEQAQTDAQLAQEPPVETVDETLARSEEVTEETGQEYVGDVNTQLISNTEALQEIQTKMADGTATEDDLKEIDRLITERKQLEEAKKSHEKLNVVEVSTPEEATAAVEAVKESPEKAQATFFSMAQDPSQYDAEQVAALAQDKNLSPAQREFAQGFAEYQSAVERAASLESVNDDIMKGNDPTFVSITTRINEVAKAVSANDPVYAASQVRAMERFIKHQENKLAKGQANGAAHSPRFVETVTAEITALKKAHKFLSEELLYGFEQFSSQLAPEAQTETVDTPDVTANQEFADVVAQREEAGDTVSYRENPVSTDPIEPVIAPAEEVTSDVDGSVTESIQYTNPEYNSSKAYTQKAPPLSAPATYFNSRTEPRDTPLDREENLFHKLATNPEVRTRMTKNLTPNQKSALPLVERFIKSFGDKVVASTRVTPNVSVGKDGTVYENQFNDLFSEFASGTDENTLLDENLVSTMGLVAHNWVTTHAGNLITNQDDAINAILGRDSKHYVTKAERAALKDAGLAQNTLVEALGTEALNELGLKPTKDAPVDMEGHMRTSIGTKMVQTLIDTGIVEEVFVTGLGTDNPVVHTTQPKVKGGYARFVRPVTQTVTEDAGNGKKFQVKRLGKGATALKENAERSEKMIDAMFGIATGQEEVITNIDDIPEYKTDMEGNPLSDRQAAALTEHSKRAHSFKADNMKLFKAMSKGGLAQLLGYNWDIETTVHKERQEGAEAKNEAIVRSLETIDNLFTKMGDKPFFFRHTVAKNKRMHMVAGDGVSIQSDKLHRHLIKMDSWVATVDPKNEQHMDMFRAAVGEALGVGVDKNDVQKTNEAFNKLLSDPAVIEAVDAVSDALAGHSFNEQAIVDLALAEEGAFTLDGLVALAQYLDSGRQPFQVDLFREVDGITNGVAIGMLQLVGATSYADTKEVLARTGIFLDEDQSSYGEWYNDPKNDDSYQDLTKAILTHFNKPDLSTNIRIFGKDVEVSHDQVLQAKTGLEMFLGDMVDAEGLVTKAGRNLTKSPLMITNYGASIAKIIEDTKLKVIDTIYDSLEKAASLNQPDQETELVRIEQAVALIIRDNSFKIDRNNILGSTLTKEQADAVGYATEVSYGRAMETGIKAKYGRFQEHAKMVNHAIGLSFNAFVAMYDQLISEVEGEVTNGDVRRILRRLEPFSSIIATALSNQVKSNQAALDGVNFVNRAKSRAVTDGVENREKQVKHAYIEDGKTKSKTFSIYEKQFQDPGVAPAVLLIQSLDASTIVGLIEKQGVLNVHDAAGMHMTDTASITNQFNQSFHAMNGEYSLFSAALETLNKSLDGYRRITGDSELQNLTFDERTDQVYTDGRPVNPTDFVKSMEAVDKVIGSNRKVIYQRMTNMVQYNAEKGAFVANPSVNPNVNGEDLFKTVPEQHRYEPIGAYVAKDADQLAEDAPSEEIKEEAQPTIETATARELSPEQEEVIKRLVNMVFRSTDRSSIARQVVTYIREGRSVEEAFHIAKNNNDSVKVNAVQRRLEATYGSSSETGSASDFAGRAKDVTTDNVTEIYDDLSKLPTQTQITPSHDKRLKDVLGSVQKVLRPLKLKVRQVADQNTSGFIKGDSVYVTANTGLAKSNIEMTPQEVYTHELVHAISSEGLNEFGVARKEVTRLFRLAEKYMTVDDMLDANATDADRAQAQAVYDHVFNNRPQTTETVNPYSGIKTKETHSHHLDEFLAMGTTNEPFIKGLLKAEARFPAQYKAKDKTVAARIKAVLDNLLNWFSERLLGYSGKTIDVKMHRLLEKVSATENRQKSAIYKNLSRVGDTVTEWGEAGLKKAHDTLSSVLNSDMLGNSRFAPIRATSGLANQVVSGNTEGLMKAMGEFTNKTGIAKSQIMQDLWVDITQGSNARKVVQLMTKGNHLIDQARKRTITNYSKYITGMSKTEITKEVAASMTRAVLKTDLEVLVQKYGLVEAVKMLHGGADKIIDNHIRNLETQLFEGFQPYYNFYQTMGRNLGYYMATGKSLRGHLLYNAHQIANLAGTNRTPEGNYMDSVELINELASLYALKFTPKKDRQAAYDYANAEIDWGDVTNTDNVFMATIISHREMKAKSLEKLFHGNPAQMIKGYVKETFNPNIDVTVATEDKEADLLTMGYEKLGQVQQDPSMTGGVKKKAHYYVLKNGASTKYMAGALSLTNMTAKGTDLIGLNEQQSPVNPSLGAYIDKLVLDRNKAAVINDIFNTGGSAFNGNIAAPILDDKYNVTGYRYIMNEDNKKNLLERHDDFRQVLGASFASIEDKVSSNQINKEVMDHIIDEANKATPEELRDDFIVLDPKSPIKEYSDAYRLIPSEIRHYAKTRTGSSSLRIKRSQYNMLFGFRTFSVSQLRQSKDPMAQGARLLNQELMNLVKKMLNNKVTRSGETIWQETVGIVKDTVVIKNVTTMVGNLLSNTAMLAMLGVPIQNIIKDQIVAMRATYNYNKVNGKLFDIEEELKRGASPARTRKLMQDKARFENDLRVNPVADLVNAGLYQTIVEDVETAENPFSYTSKLEGLAEPVVAKLPKPVVSAAKFLAVTHDTALYQVLSQLTQMSDFAARYALHKYNTTRDKKPMKFEDSVDDVLDTFINYDIPTNKGLQYMNDMGLVMFTKYFLRVQKVIIKAWGERPAQTFFTWMAASLLGLPTVIDSAILGAGDLLAKFNFNPWDLASSMFGTAPMNLLLK